MKSLRLAFGAALLIVAASSAHADVPISLHGERLIVLAPRHAVRSGSARFQLDAPIPAHPYTSIHEADERLGFASTMPLVLDDGTVVVGVSSPPAITWVGPDGHVRVTAHLDERPTGEIAPGADGRVFVSSDSRTLYTLGPDGTVRATISPESTMPPLPGGAIARDDGSLLVIAYGSTGTITFLAPSGERVATHPLTMRVSSAQLGPDGCVWLLGPQGVGCVDPSGQFREAAFGRGASQLTPISSQAVAVLLATELQIRSPRGELRGRAVMSPPVQWIVPMPSGGVTLLRSAPAQELVFLGPDATAIAHVAVVPSTARVLGALSDANGALVTFTADGTVVAFEPDGTERWRLETRRRLAPRTGVPLRRGGFVLALAEGGLLFVH